MAGENSVRPKGLKAKIENFWYHYKTHTIISIIAAIALTVSIVQCSTKPDYDYKIVVATRSIVLSTPQLEAITKELKQYGEDLNGDGEVNILLIDCTIDENNSDHQTAFSRQEKIQVLTSDAEAILFLTDTKFYDWSERLNPRTQFFEDSGLPDNDGKGFLVSDTHIIENPKKSADYEKGLRWPKDLSICSRKIKGTKLENDDTAKASKKAAEEFIQRIIEKNTK